MQTINLIRPVKSDIKFNIIQFPDGEPHIVLENIDRKDKVTVICRISNPNDLFILMQIGDILNRQGVIFKLFITYLMSMRMDRVISFNESYSLKVVTEIINNMFPNEVTVLEPHSYKVKSLINAYYIPFEIPMPNFEGYLYVLPDKGAKERYNFPPHLTVYCSKVRNLSTGKLSGFSIENPEIITNNPDMPLVVIDDLCDGGGTFVGIAAELKKIAPNRKLSIYVVHMVNPKGIIALSKNFNEVYFTNSYKDWENEILPNNVRVIEIV